MTESRIVDYSELFDLDDPMANRPLRLAPQQDWIGIPEAKKLFYGEWQPPEPIIFKGYMGGSVTDILWTGFIPLVCVSARVIDLLLENRFTGWGTYPVEVYGRKGEPIPGYYGFAVKSYAGKADYSRSAIITKPPPSPAGNPYQAYRGLYFDESQWDGSDIFRVQHAVIVVTRPVQKAFKRARITNVQFVPLEEHEIGVGTVRIINKGREIARPGGQAGAEDGTASPP